MTPITPSQFQEWQRLAEQATPGPWVARQPRVKIVIQSEDRQKVGWYISQDVLKLSDAQFIAAAREAVPAMLQEIERLQPLIGGLQSDNRNLHREVEGLRLERDALRLLLKQARHELYMSPEVVTVGAYGADRECPSCEAPAKTINTEPWEIVHHKPDCPRQLALAALDAVLDGTPPTASEPGSYKNARGIFKLKPESDEPPAMAVPCTWSEDSEGNWETACGHLYTITAGSPKENEMVYCTFCGKPLTETPYTPASFDAEDASA